MGNQNEIQHGSNMDRGPDGKFLPGHAVKSFGGGRPKENNSREYLNILREELTPEKWRELIRCALEDAVGSDSWARDKGRNFLAKYVLPQKIEMEISGEIPVQIVGVEKFTGWGKNIPVN